MRQVFEQILKMPYYKNYAAASGKVHNEAKHEDAVADILCGNGFTEHRPPSAKPDKSCVTVKQRDSWLEDPYSCDIPEGTYISQPCGKNNSPDFIVKSQGKAHFIECKSVSGKTKSPMYNSGVPKKGYIYVFCAAGPDETTIFFGEDVMPPEDYARLQELISEHRALDAKFNALLRSPYGIEHYTRPMMKHVGGVNYFTHSRRSELETRVLDSV